MIQHIVLFTPKTTLAPAARRAFAAAVVKTLRDCPHVARCVVGRRVAVNAGYERSFGDKTYEFSATLEFDDRQALIAYLNDAGHASLGRLFWECCENSVVCETDSVSLGSIDAVSTLAE